MERKKTEQGPVPVFALAKCLLASYILTAVLLLLLALLLYKVGLTEGIVSIAITAIYVLATFLAGFLAGKRMQSRKFFWGFVLGMTYFLVLALVSFLVNRSVDTLGTSFFTTMVLCAAGGTLGGMLG